MVSYAQQKSKNWLVMRPVRRAIRMKTLPRNAVMGRKVFRDMMKAVT